MAMRVDLAELILINELNDLRRRYGLGVLYRDDLLDSCAQVINTLQSRAVEDNREIVQSAIHKRIVAAGCGLVFVVCDSDQVSPYGSVFGNLNDGLIRWFYNNGHDRIGVSCNHFEDEGKTYWTLLGACNHADHKPPAASIGNNPGNPRRGGAAGSGDDSSDGPSPVGIPG